MGFQVILVVKNPLANAGDTRDAGSIPGLLCWQADSLLSEPPGEQGTCFMGLL